jgi:RNA polymerase sporulation-specific sigma factor
MGPSPEGASRPRPISPLGEEELRKTLHQALAGDGEARQRIIQSHLRLVWDIVRRFAGRGADTEDLFQIGCVGLVTALDRFDLSYGTRFSTYAVPLILGEIRRHLRDDGPVKVSRRVKELAREAWRMQEEMTKATGRVPTVTELAKALGVEAAEVAESLEAARLPLSLFRESRGEGADDCFYLIDQLAASGDVAATTAGRPVAGGAEEERFLEGMALREALSRLDERDRRLLTLRFFEDKTQAGVGEALGVSQVQVSRLEKQALLKLRAMLSSE